MLGLPSFTIWSLWIIFVFMGIFAILGMAIGNKLRGARIENKEDHTNAKTAIISTLPLLMFFLLLVFAPIAPGILFWAGLLFNLIAAVIYLLAIAAFVKAGKGITTVGIYRLSRNPMYVAMFLIFTGFTLMAWSAAVIMGVLTAMVLLWNTFTTNWMVRGEEKFLEDKYGQTYLNYKHNTPRYFFNW